MISQIKELSTETYLSFSDKTKIKMNQQQFFVPKEDVDEIIEWLEEEIKYPYFIEDSSANKDSRWILFVDEADAMAFKLRWM